MGDDIIVLSSNEAISDLPEKRSSIYSDRVSGPTVLKIRSSHKAAASIGDDATVRLYDAPGCCVLTTDLSSQDRYRGLGVDNDALR